MTKRDPIVEAVRADLLRRSQLGIEKYGVTLDRRDLSLRDWLQHAYEETLDQANYLKRAIVEISTRTSAPSDDDGVATCPICRVPFRAGDTCSTDIEMGQCHAAYLEGAPHVDLETGEVLDGPIPSHPYEPVLLHAPDHSDPADTVAALRTDNKRLTKVLDAFNACHDIGRPEDGYREEAGVVRNTADYAEMGDYLARPLVTEAMVKAACEAFGLHERKHGLRHRPAGMRLALKAAMEAGR